MIQGRADSKIHPSMRSSTMSRDHKTRSNVGKNPADQQDPTKPEPVASEFTTIGNGTPLLADAIIAGGGESAPAHRTSTSIGAEDEVFGQAFSDRIINGVESAAAAPSGLEEVLSAEADHWPAGLGESASPGVFSFSGADGVLWALTSGVDASASGVQAGP